MQARRCSRAALDMRRMYRGAAGGQSEAGSIDWRHEAIEMREDYTTIRFMPSPASVDQRPIADEYRKGFTTSRPCLLLTYKHSPLPVSLAP
jgi:hypothetical protein